MAKNDPWLDDLYRRYKDQVFGFIRRKINSQSDAEDLCSQVFLEATRCADKFDPERASESTWLFTIARNLLNRRLRDHYTRQRIVRFEPLGDQDYASDPWSTESEEVEAFVQSDELAGALETLDEGKRNIILLSFYYGLGPKEIAEKLKLSYSNVCTLKSRALDELRGVLS
ncbi:specialized sigma subunit of RNA polymerase [Spirochaetia bacterium]|nr:specialized sigma subunit of RNA polymerase [Spirochaetia bacterium]